MEAMQYEEIEELLDRYWEGETTLEEERALKAYFNAGFVDERLRRISPIFQAFREEQNVQLASKAKTPAIRPQMFQWAVAATLALLLTAGWWLLRDGSPNEQIADKTPVELPNKMDKQEVEVPQLPLATVEEATSKPIVARKKSLPRQKKQAPAIDPETAKAMAEIKAALALVSSKLDKGRQEAVKRASYLEVMEKLPRKTEG